jgi:7-carboxy-7-deazaguanine synthase
VTAYAVKEVFGPTLQGEGYHAGRVAVFVRFAGCNLWSGVEGHRERHADANGAHCPLWCDTDFRGGDRLTHSEVVERVRTCMGDPPLIVLTGGEPLLQVDRGLVEHLLHAFRRTIVTIETNGTQPLPFKYGKERTWVTMSPKVPRAALKLEECDEVKVVYPAYDPAEYLGVPARHRFVQPQAAPETTILRGRRLTQERLAAEYCMTHPDWRLSLQTHKVVGLP